MPIGRPSDYTPLLDSIAETGNLSRSCRETGMSKSAFLAAVGKDEALADQYARAREVGLDAEADRGLEEALTAKDAGIGRLALDARKWYLSKLYAHKYGDKIDVTSGDKPLNPPAEDIAAQTAALFAKAQARANP